MTAPVVDALSPQSSLERVFEGLKANADPYKLLEELGKIEPKLQGNATLRAQFLRARGLAYLRAGEGFGISEALGDLYEALRLLEVEDDAGGLAKVLLDLATVFIWRGDGREASLAILRAIAEAESAGDQVSAAMALVQAGQLQIENGRPRDAQAILARAVALGGSALSKHEYQRAWQRLLQATVAARLIDKAKALRSDAQKVLAGASPRVRFLERLDCVRIERLCEDYAAARAALAQAKELAPEDPKKFEYVEIAEVEAELALAEGNAEEAARLFHDVVIARFAEDELVAREIQARLQHAEALEQLSRWEEADLTLAAALRIALARGLNGFADQVRSRIAIRGSDEQAGVTGDVPREAALPDFAARFVRRRPLGAGGYAKVERAYDLELGVEVAIKRSALSNVVDPSLRGRLLEAARTEVQAASRLNHPGIARVYGLLADANGDSILVEEYVEGPTLRKEMERRLDTHRIYDILSRVAYSLAAVHATGVVHRDIKPDNVILRGGGPPVLVDFGIAMLSETEEGSVGGTPGYMPPEQEHGENVDARADLYALGVTAYEMLMGERLNAEPSKIPAIFTEFWRLRGIRGALIDAGVDAEAANLITRMMARRPHKRPESAAVAGAAFTEAATRAAPQPHKG